ncbi:hypothetical protein Mal33_45630 [Rosistilla oblonga]|uniref:Uncharacterized protein n=1 Tax=Rosistilla oblonga TaxID=2527990 RepID=A0A518IZL4_9BACT|nr:hypothetical protein Mal33_45630 [Rosistilla oblonga]
MRVVGGIVAEKRPKPLQRFWRGAAHRGGKRVPWRVATTGASTYLLSPEKQVGFPPRSGLII